MNDKLTGNSLPRLMRLYLLEVGIMEVYFQGVG